MIVDLGPIPVFARRVLLDDARGFFFDLRDEPAHEGHREHAPHPQGGAQAPRGDSSPEERGPAERAPGVPPGAAWLPALLFFVSVVAACSPPSGDHDHRAGIVPTRPLASLTSGPASLGGVAAGDTSRRSGEAVPALLLAQLDDLHARAERLASTASVAQAAGSACAQACEVWGPRELALEHGRARCVCRGAPNLGTRRIAR